MLKNTPKYKDIVEEIETIQSMNKSNNDNNYQELESINIYNSINNIITISDPFSNNTNEMDMWGNMYMSQGTDLYSF